MLISIASIGKESYPWDTDNQAGRVGLIAKSASPPQGASQVSVDRIVWLAKGFTVS